MHPFALERECLLADVVNVVENDNRFVAGWLSGSYGRSQQDRFSDLDINLWWLTRMRLHYVPGRKWSPERWWRIGWGFLPNLGRLPLPMKITTMRRRAAPLLSSPTPKPDKRLIGF